MQASCALRSSTQARFPNSSSRSRGRLCCWADTVFTSRCRPSKQRQRQRVARRGGKGGGQVEEVPGATLLMSSGHERHAEGGRTGGGSVHERRLWLRHAEGGGQVEEVFVSSGRERHAEGVEEVSRAAVVGRHVEGEGQVEEVWMDSGREQHAEWERERGVIAG
eukprot:48922-Chlamydomonas_euryale.AAC.2